LALHILEKEHYKMRAYEIQPTDHVGDYEVRERHIDGFSIVEDGTMRDNTTRFVVGTTFADSGCRGFELEFSREEFRVFLAKCYRLWNGDNS
jgi:hypothetical protein